MLATPLCVVLFVAAGALLAGSAAHGESHRPSSNPPSSSPAALDQHAELETAAELDAGIRKWRPPGPDDVRSPCPILNTLANHGYLPHSGRNISESNTVEVLQAVLNINVMLAKFLFAMALTTTPRDQNATTFSLDSLSRHDRLEHDASLRDTYFDGDANSFDQAVFDETRSYWRGPVIDIRMAAQARAGRTRTSRRTNPNFTMTENGELGALMESSSYLFVLGGGMSGRANRSWVEYMFKKERLPTSLGWRRPTQMLGQKEIYAMVGKIVKAMPADDDDDDDDEGGGGGDNDVDRGKKRHGSRRTRLG